MKNLACLGEGRASCSKVKAVLRMYIPQLIDRMLCRSDQILHGMPPQTLTMDPEHRLRFQEKGNPASALFCQQRTLSRIFVGCHAKRHLPLVQSNQSFHNPLNERAWMFVLKYQSHLALLLFEIDNVGAHHCGNHWCLLSLYANSIRVFRICVEEYLPQADFCRYSPNIPSALSLINFEQM